jgi:lipopolysaccharide export LptBFGC system permease protein LptF
MKLSRHEKKLRLEYERKIKERNHMMVVLTEEEYNKLRNVDNHLFAKNQIKNSIMKVIRAYTNQLQSMPDGSQFLMEISLALEKPKE